MVSRTGPQDTYDTLQKYIRVTIRYKFPEFFAQPKHGTNHNNKDDPNLQHSKATMGQVTTETEEHPRF